MMEIMTIRGELEGEEEEEEEEAEAKKREHFDRSSRMRRIRCIRPCRRRFFLRLCLFQLVRCVAVCI